VLMDAFFRANRRLSGRITRHLDYAKRYVQEDYVRAVADAIDQGGLREILDIGCGKQVPYRALVQRPVRIIGADIAREELDQNPDLHRGIVCDVSDRIPLDDASVDLVCSRSVLEHLPSLDGFFREAARVLRPGGYFIHSCPSRYAPFAVLNRWIPKSISNRLLFRFQPEQVGICGFPAMYDRCWPAAVRRLAAQHGFLPPEIRVQYFSSSYYDFFLPLFLASVAYESVIATLDVETLCAAMLIQTRKAS
jgi:SAM-dependent methyltransferase